MTKTFEDMKKEAYEKASMKSYGNTAGSIQMRHLLNELENAGLLKSHQPLPVVPECIVEWIEILKTKGLKPLKNPETYGETGFTEEKLQNIVFWISENQEDYMRAWLDGYTVEKPKRFYLKNKLTTSYLALENKTGYYCHISPITESSYWKASFTKEDIDAMEDTRSYEKIEVVE